MRYPHCSVAALLCDPYPSLLSYLLRSGFSVKDIYPYILSLWKSSSTAGSRVLLQSSFTNGVFCSGSDSLALSRRRDQLPAQAVLVACSPADKTPGDLQQAVKNFAGTA